ncbi:MAG: dihydrodipicolinate synthase family protein [Chloroflexi bacterium]|nr:dihydrodipicolinate synthase family protein [Chloroflexota bacterium]
MTISVMLPRSDGTLLPYTPGVSRAFAPSSSQPRSRVAYAAAHVVGNPLVDASAPALLQIDWEATLAYRRYLWSFGLSVAEAMDTAQRGMGLDWKAAQELIRRSVAEARAFGGAGIACGAGTEQLAPAAHLTLSDVEEAYEEQCSFVEGVGGQIILMASRALAACAKRPDDYVRVYSKILSQVARPVILHWLGEMFDPALAGYWGFRDIDAAMEVCLQIIERHTSKIDGIKISLLDAEREITMRRRLPNGVRMYTGDDFNYPELIRGDEQGYSHALLGIFDAIAPAAASALQALDEGDLDRYEAILAPTVPLARHIFQAPTYSYKTGIVFLAYLNGHQPHFRMLAGMESARSIVHLADILILADKAGLLLDPELAAERMRKVLAVAGFDREV